MQRLEEKVEAEADGIFTATADSRRAVFKMGSQLFAAKLVDLPTILETHKTLDARQLFKIADISQMLLVTHQIQSEAEATRAAPPPPPPDREGSAHINADTAQTLPGAGEYVFDHGITPPMRFARKRRFRRRAHKRVSRWQEKASAVQAGADARASTGHRNRRKGD